MAQTSLPHVEWIDLRKNGIAEEIIVMSKNQNNGDIYYIAISELDTIDRQRILRVLHRKDAAKYPLFDLLSQETLKNGMNALEFFHQLVKIRTVNGTILSVGSGKQGASSFTVNPGLAPQADSVSAAKAKKAAAVKAE